MTREQLIAHINAGLELAEDKRAWVALKAITDLHMPIEADGSKNCALCRVPLTEGMQLCPTVEVIRSTTA